MVDVWFLATVYLEECVEHEHTTVANYISFVYLALPQQSAEDGCYSPSRKKPYNGSTD